MDLEAGSTVRRSRGETIAHVMGVEPAEAIGTVRIEDPELVTAVGILHRVGTVWHPFRSNQWIRMAHQIPVLHPIQFVAAVVDQVNVTDGQAEALRPSNATEATVAEVVKVVDDPATAGA